MLPAGHVAGGYLSAYALLKITKLDLDIAQFHQLLYIGAFFGFTPDLDVFVAFAKVRGFTFSDHEKTNHRNFFTHAPILWLAIGLLVYSASQTVFVSYTGLLIWLGAWSHFLLDSLQSGIMWLWPFSSYHYTFKDREIQIPPVQKKGFFLYWLSFLRFYKNKLSLTYYSEIIIILIALYVFIFLG